MRGEEEAVEFCKRTHPSPRVNVDKTLSVLLFEASISYLRGPMMICMGSECPELNHLQGREDLILWPKLDVYTYKAHLLRGARRFGGKAALGTKSKSP